MTLSSNTNPVVADDFTTGLVSRDDYSTWALDNVFHLSIIHFYLIVFTACANLFNLWNFYLYLMIDFDASNFENDGPSRIVIDIF